MDEYPSFTASFIIYALIVFAMEAGDLSDSVKMSIQENLSLSQQIIEKSRKNKSYRS